jgi:hypothetical protein
MPFPALRKRSRHDDDDWFPFVVKLAVILVIGGLLVGFLLVSGGGDGTDDTAATNPAVPTITDSPGPATSEPAARPRPEVNLARPAMGTQTAVIKKAKPTAKPKPRPSEDPRIARIGKPCRTEGAIAFTKRFEPLICRDGRWERAF